VRRLAFDRTLPAACEALRPCRLRGNDNPQRQNRPERLRHLPDGPSAPTTGRSTPEANPYPPTPSHTWAELLRLVGAARRPGVDRSLDDADRSRRIRDAFCEYDGEFDDGK
jgi:hypothetical protein